MTAFTSTGPIHFTFHHEQFEEPLMINNHWIKGFTRCSLTIGLATYHASSYCSWNDSFNKEIGRKLALRNVLEMAQISRETRREVWMSYFNRAAHNIPTFPLSYNTWEAAL